MVITPADLLPWRRVLPPPEPEAGPQPGDLDRLWPGEHDAVVFGSWHPPAYHGIPVPVQDNSDQEVSRG